MKQNLWVWVLLIAGVVGFIDASYLTWEHFRDVVPPCEITWMTRVLGSWSDCGRVLSSEWATIGEFPVAGLGMVYYAGVMGWAVVEVGRKKLQETASNAVQARNKRQIASNKLQDTSYKIQETASNAVQASNKKKGASTGMGVVWVVWGLVKRETERLPGSMEDKWYGLLGLMAMAGLATSGVLVYLMFGVIKSVCVYCLVSAVNTVVIGVCVYKLVRARE